MKTLFRDDSEPRLVEFLNKQKERFVLLASSDFISQIYYSRRDTGSKTEILFPIDSLVSAKSVGAGSADRTIIVADPSGEKTSLEEARKQHRGRRVVGLGEHVLPALVARAGHLIFADAETVPPVKRLIILFATPRSGSSFVADVLSDIGMGDVREHLRSGIIAALHSSYEFDREQALVNFLRFAQRNGVVGTKLITHFFTEALSGGELEIARRVCSDLPIDFLTIDRRDKVAQAISSEIASRRGVWHVTDAETADAVRCSREIDFSFSSLLARYLRYRQETETLSFLKSAVPAHLPLSYEEDVNSGDFAALAEKISSYLGLELRDWRFERSSKRRRISDDLNAKMAARFRDGLSRYFKGCDDRL